MCELCSDNSDSEFLPESSLEALMRRGLLMTQELVSFVNELFDLIADPSVSTQFSLPVLAALGETISNDFKNIAEDIDLLLLALAVDSGVFNEIVMKIKGNTIPTFEGINTAEDLLKAIGEKNGNAE